MTTIRAHTAGGSYKFIIYMYSDYYWQPDRQMMGNSMALSDSWKQWFFQLLTVWPAH